MKIKGLTEKEDLHLKVTLGRQRKTRFYSPFGSAKLLKKALDAGEQKKNLKDKVKVSVDMINKIMRLNSIKHPQIISSIEWMASGTGQISMSVASELARLANNDDQLTVFKGIQENNFTKEEVKELVTLYNRSGLSIEECIEQIRKAKPEIIHTLVIIGKILSDRLIRKLSTIPDLDRNILFRRVLDSHFPSLNYKGVKLKKGKFIIIGGEQTKKTLNSIENGLEEYITSLLMKELF